MKAAETIKRTAGPKPRRGDLFVETEPPHPHFLFFSGAVQDIHQRSGDEGACLRYAGIRNAPLKNKKINNGWGPRSIHRSPLRGLGLNPHRDSRALRPERAKAAPGM